MLHIALCEDDIKTSSILEKFVSEYFSKIKIPVKIDVYTKSKQFMYDLTEQAHFDLILTDIEMPELNGMELAVKIKQCLPDALIIFITSHLKYAVDSFELSIFRYIPKNQIKERLPHALEDASNMILMQSDKYYMIQTTGRFERIAYKKIVHIAREGKNAAFYLIDGSKSKVRKSLNKVFEELNSDDFIFADRGEIINLLHILAVTDGNIEMQNGIRIAGSHSRLQQIKSALNDFWSEKI